MSPLGWCLLFVAAQRLVELRFAARNTRRLRARGAVEHGAGHYPLIVALHAAWLLSLLVFVPWRQPPTLPWLAAFFLLQPLRGWIIASLGERWTTRVLVLPGAPPVARGPYRWLAHPNYLLVAGEILTLPLAFGAPRLALLFTALNALLLLGVRIPVENAALGRQGGNPARPARF